MHYKVITLLSLSLTALASPANFKPRTTENGSCKGADGKPGVCIHTSKCTQGGGSFVSNACPDQPDDIKCCTKPSCGSSGGSCAWTSGCTSGKTTKNLCPGPDDFMCCEPKSGGGSGSGSSGSVGQKVLAKAETAKGTKYVWGGGSCKGTTEGGYDCSGLVGWALCQVTGRDLFAENLRVTYSMYCASEAKLKYKKVPLAKRQAGDAIFFGGKCDCSKKGEDTGIHHVALVKGSGTMMLNAPHTGAVVREEDWTTWSDKPCPDVIRFS